MRQNIFTYPQTANFYKRSVTDGYFKGYFADPTALETAYPVGLAGWFAIVGSTDTIWVWDTGTNDWVDTGNSTPGDVIGPASSTDNALVRFNGASGKLIQNSGIIIDDSNNITGVANITPTGNILSGAGLGIKATGSGGFDLIAANNDVVARIGSGGTGTLTLPQLLNGALVTNGSGAVTALSYGSTAVASTLVQRDANANIFMNSVGRGYQVIATAGGVTTLTNNSPYYTEFTGSSNQTVVLPVADTMTQYQEFEFIFKGTGTSTITFQTSGGSNLTFITHSGYSKIQCIDPNGGTGTASWRFFTGNSSSASPSQLVNCAVVRNINGDFAGRDIGASRTMTATTSMVSAAFISSTANPSTTGTARLASSNSIGWRNQANSADLLLSKDTNDVLTWAGRASFNSTQSPAVTLTDAATVAIDLSLSKVYNLVLGGNRTFGIPTNVAVGQEGTITVRQDSTGSRTLSYSWPYIFPQLLAPILTTGKGAMDLLAYKVLSYSTATATMTIATPCVVTWTGHGLVYGQRVAFTTTGALPTGVTANTGYYINVIDADTFNLATSLANLQAGTYVATSGSQSGVHTATNMAIEISMNANNGA